MLGDEWRCFPIIGVARKEAIHRSEMIKVNPVMYKINYWRDKKKKTVINL